MASWAVGITPSPAHCPITDIARPQCRACSSENLAFAPSRSSPARAAILLVCSEGRPFFSRQHASRPFLEAEDE